MSEGEAIPVDGEVVARRRVRAFNFAHDSENRIHDDAVAREYGFRGGLVPGVAVWAYLADPAVEALGVEWLERGWMQARFVRPVYDGDEVTAVARRREDGVVGLELHDSGGERCAYGEAGWLDEVPVLEPAFWPATPLPAPDARASIEEIFSPGTVLGSLELPPLEPSDLERLAERYRDERKEYRGSRAVLPPAWILDRANALLVANVELGPWIHAESRVRYLGAADWRRPCSLRGLVREALEKRGHQIVVLDLVLIDADGRIRAHVEHTAIVRPREAGAGLRGC